jgi:hypothetical protein
MPIQAASDTGGRRAVLPRGRRHTQAVADAPLVFVPRLQLDTASSVPAKISPIDSLLL